MKSDEAIEILKTWKITGDKAHEALDMAIEALAKDINVPSNDCISREAAIDSMTNTLWHYPNECYRNLNEYEFAKGLAELGLKSVPSAQPKRTCVNCGRTVNNGGWYADGRTRCPIEEHYALPKDGYCHLWEKRNVTDDDYPERREK